MFYFDHNATTPLLPQARDAWLEASEKFIGNPSSPHRLGGRADKALNEARETLAKMLGCDALDLVWTSGATEAANLALHHFATTSEATEIWVSAIEHPCVLGSAQHYFRHRLQIVPMTHAGIVDWQWIEERLKQEKPGALIVMAANNETGALQPWKELAGMCREHAVPFFCDATQWIGKLPAAGFGQCDFVSGSAHKFGGPKGVGFLKCQGKGRVEPLLLGGQQEEGRRAGTENVPGVMAMLAALKIREAALARGEVEARWQWRRNFERRLEQRLPGSVVIGKDGDRLWNTVSALMPETDCQQRWVVKLDKLGFAVSTGSACASGREEPSHVLKAMSYSPEEAGRMLRFSSGWETREEEWGALMEALVQASSDLRGRENAKKNRGHQRIENQRRSPLPRGSNAAS